MTLEDLSLDLRDFPKDSQDLHIIEEALRLRGESMKQFAQEQFETALATNVEALRKMRDFSSFSHTEFRALLVGLLFDLSEIHYQLKDFKQSEKELELLFKVLDQMVKDDPERFGRYHVLAMELSTRILRSRKKTLELLAKQQLNTGLLYEKVHAGVSAATDKLVESLRKTAEMLAQTGDYRAAVKFYVEAIRIAKKRSGKVTRREIKMTIDMARIMMHSKADHDRARRLLNAVLPHAIALELIEFEEKIKEMLTDIDQSEAHEPMWRSFLEKLQRATRTRLRKRDEKKEKEEKEREKKEAKEKKESEGEIKETEKKIAKTEKKIEKEAKKASKK